MEGHALGVRFNVIEIDALQFGSMQAIHTTEAAFGSHDHDSGLRLIRVAAARDSATVMDSRLRSRSPVPAGG